MNIPHLKREQHSDILAALDEYGCAIIDNFLSPAVSKQVLAEVDNLRQLADPGRDHINDSVSWFFGNCTRHLTALVKHSPTLREHILPDPLLAAACDHTLLPNCSQYQLNLAHLIDRGPGAENQYLHRDHDVWFHMPKTFPLEIACMIAMEDFSEQNGATRIVPGSHHWEPGREPKPEEIVNAEMPQGAIALYTGGIIHGAGHNQSDRWRPGIHLSYTLGWLRTEENLVLSIPPSVAKDFDEQTLAMIGYRAHDAIAEGGGYLGMVDLYDPIKLVKEGRLGT